MKKMILSIITCVVMTSLITLAFAKDMTKSIDAVLNYVNISVNDKKIVSENENFTLYNGDVVPNSIVYKGTTYLPVRKLSEVLGKNVNWDGNTKTVIINDLNTPFTRSSQDARKIIEITNNKVIGHIKNNDFEALSKYIHPEKGVRFTPFSVVSDADLTFTQKQVRQFSTDRNKYTWGIFDSTGEKINLTPKEFFQDFIYIKDYANQASVGYNELIGENELYAKENMNQYLKNNILVDYYYKGSDELGSLDWSSLHLVYELYENEWYLIGIIHSENEV